MPPVTDLSAELSEDFANPTITLTDEQGKTLDCYLEQTLEVEGEDYFLLLPVNSPIEIFMWQGDPDSDTEVLVDVEDEDIEALLPTAKAVLAELDLSLQRNAYTLTAAGELPEVEEEDCFTLEVSDDDNPEAVSEEFQVLASFFHEDEQYTLCTPLEPLLFFAKRNASGEIALLSPEEFRSVQVQLEDKLFDVLE
jgi:Protein of unknown function (DUF3727)/Protein of unknown function (DUF1292)